VRPPWGAQTTLDPEQMKKWTPNSRYGGHAFGFMPDPKNNRTRDTQFAQVPRGEGEDPAVDQRIFPLRTRQRRRSADLHDLLRAARAGPGPEGPDAYPPTSG
jgi:hypothetical protein